VVLSKILVCRVINTVIALQPSYGELSVNLCCFCCCCCCCCCRCLNRYGEYYSESDEGIRAWHEAVPRLLRPGGVYSYFNGFASDNFFFHMVYGRCVGKPGGGGVHH
jgi:hypothetical protein